MILMGLVSEMWPGLRREHDSEVGWRESMKNPGFENLIYEMWSGLRQQHDSEMSGSKYYAKTNVILMSLVSEMYTGLRREHGSEVGWRDSYAKANGFENGKNPMQKPMVLRA